MCFIITASLDAIAWHETAVIVGDAEWWVVMWASSLTGRGISVCHSTDSCFLTCRIYLVIIRLSRGSSLCCCDAIIVRSRGCYISSAVMLIARMGSCPCLRHIEAALDICGPSFSNNALPYGLPSGYCTTIWRSLLFEMLALVCPYFIVSIFANWGRSQLAQQQWIVIRLCQVCCIALLLLSAVGSCGDCPSSPA